MVLDVASRMYVDGSEDWSVVTLIDVCREKRVLGTGGVPLGFGL